MIRVLRAILPNRVRRAVAAMRNRDSPFPCVVTLTDLSNKPCLFEVTGEMERGRILSLGDEGDFLRAFLAEVREGDVVFDVGSCLGLYAIPAAHSGARIFAFEPDTSFRAALVRNVNLNGLAGSITIVSWAVADQGGSATLFTDGLAGKSPSLARVGERGAKVVETDSIDAAVRRGGLPRPDLVKMDIEGAEILALRGMKELLGAPQAPRRIFVELHPVFLPAFGSSAEECMAVLNSFGYVQEVAEGRADQLHCVYARKR